MVNLALLSGCGIATFSVGVSQTSYWLPQSKQGYAAGIYGGVGNLAPGIFMVIMPNIAPPLWGASGWIVGIGALGGFVIPPLMASFIDKSGENLTGYSTGFVVFIVLNIIALIILALINKIQKENVIHK